MSTPFNFENYLLSIGAKLHKKRMGNVPEPLKVSEYEYKDFQFLIFTNEHDIKTTLCIVRNWDLTNSIYCASIPRNVSFASELIDHIVNYKGQLEDDKLN